MKDDWSERDITWIRKSKWFRHLQTFPLYKAACACKGDEIVNACMTYVYRELLDRNRFQHTRFFFRTQKELVRFRLKNVTSELKIRILCLFKFKLDEMRTKIWSKTLNLLQMEFLSGSFYLALEVSQHAYFNFSCSVLQHHQLVYFS